MEENNLLGHLFLISASRHASSTFPCRGGISSTHPLTVSRPHRTGMQGGKADLPPPGEALRWGKAEVTVPPDGGRSLHTCCRQTKHSSLGRPLQKGASAESPAGKQSGRQGPGDERAGAQRAGRGGRQALCIQAGRLTGGRLRAGRHPAQSAQSHVMQMLRPGHQAVILQLVLEFLTSSNCGCPRGLLQCFRSSCFPVISSVFHIVTKTFCRKQIRRGSLGSLSKDWHYLTKSGSTLEPHE